MKKRFYDKKDFKSLSLRDFRLWVSLYKKKLTGSAIFTSNDSLISKVVSWAESWKNKNAQFKPSHVGSIVLKDDVLYVVDIKPPKNKLRPLEDYLLNNKDDYKLYLPSFKLNKQIFSKQLLEKVGELYPVFSAIRSVFTKRKTKYAQHCSEAWLRAVQLQGFFENINPECTPLELYELLLKEG